MNGHGSSEVNSVNGKAPALDNGNIIKVEPPRREDLQPSYAQVIKPDTEDASQHGWYGSMINGLGSLIGNLGAIPCCIVCPNVSLSKSHSSIFVRRNAGCGLSRRLAVNPAFLTVVPMHKSTLMGGDVTLITQASELLLTSFIAIQISCTRKCRSGHKVWPFRTRSRSRSCEDQPAV